MLILGSQKNTNSSRPPPSIAISHTGHLKYVIVIEIGQLIQLYFQYLSPERARGIPHDTRKSDVWSLGITFFEILVGRTPFENTDGEQLNTKDDLENYWQRTLCGTWIGNWKMTAEMEKLLQCMIAPNADLRCTTSQAMAHEMWHLHPASTKSHSKNIG